MAALGFICTLCGHRQPSSEPCSGCADDAPLDLDSPATIEFLRQLEQYDRDRRDGRVRMAAVVFSISTLALLMTQAWWWEFRSKALALPFLLDQVALMVLLAFGTIALYDKLSPPWRRSPVLDEL